MAAAEAAEAVIAQMPAADPPPIAAGAVLEPPPVAAGAVVEPPPVAASAVVVVAPPPPVAASADVVETFVAPPPVAADAAVAPPPTVADAVETVGTPPPSAAAPIQVVPSPPPPLEQKIQSVMDGGEEPLPSEILKVIERIEVRLPSLADDEKPCDMVTDVKENETIPLVLPSSDSECYPTKKPEETVQPLGHLLVEEQLAMVVSDNNSKESDKQVPTQPCLSSQQQIPMLGDAVNEENQDVSSMSSSMVLIDNRPPQATNSSLGDAVNEENQDVSSMSSSMVLIDNRPPQATNSLGTDDRSDDSPMNSNDDNDHSDGGYCYDTISCWDDPYYHHHRFFLGRERRYHRYPYIRGTRRDPWYRDYQRISGVEAFNPMACRDTEPWSHWSSPEPGCGKKRYNVGAGLFNPHWWTCFLNCILQCMVHTVPLVLKLRKADHPDPCPRASIGFCCFCSLKLHADESIRLSGSAFYPERFVNHLKSISSKFESGVQQDVQEFYSDLLEKLDESCVAPRSSQEPSSTEEGGIAKEIFGGRLKSQLRCPGCNRCSDKSEPFLDLSLEVVESLMDALHSFTKVELIEDFMCDGCNSRVNMEKHLKVEQAPEVLVIHLKRFTNSGGKISDMVKYPLELDINSFMSSLDDTPQKYDLYGVVVHHGIYGRGHYVCYIRSSEDDWYEFNDDKVSRCFEARVLDNAAYLLFYVKQGSSPWFSTLLEKEDKFPQDGSVSLADQGTSEFALVNKDESTFSHGRDNLGYCLVGPAEENGNGPTLPEISQGIHQNGNDNTLSDLADKLAEGCCLGGMSGRTQELSCLTGSSDKNGHADSFFEPWEKEDVSLRDSLDTNEVNTSTHESSEIDPTVTEGGSPPKICSLLQVSHKYDDMPWEKEDVIPRGTLDMKEMNPSTHGYSEVDPVVTPGGSLPKGENICSLLQLSHKYDDKSWEKEDVSPRESLNTKELNPSTHESSEVDPAVTQEGSSPKSENIWSLLQLSHKYDGKPCEKEDVSPSTHEFSEVDPLDTKELNPSTKELNPNTHEFSEVDPAVTQGGSSRKSEDICSLLQLSHKCGNDCGSRNFSSQEDETGGCSGAQSMGMCTSENETVESESKSNHEIGGSKDGATKGCRDEGNGGCTSEKRKRLSCADTDGGGDGESNASKGRTKLRAVARNFHLCRRRALAAAGEWRKGDDDGN